jgi:mono/diheme cytochrome c family protein
VRFLATAVDMVRLSTRSLLDLALLKYDSGMPNALFSRALVISSAVALATTVAVLAAQTPQKQQPPAGGGRAGAPQTRGLPPMGAGPKDVPLVEIESAERGKKVWAAECINCHGTQARGTDNGPNVVRSLVVLRDRYGSELGPFLKKGHKLQSGGGGTSLTDEQIRDLANFLRDRVNDSLRGSPLFQAQNVLVGDAKAGAEFFNGQCATCHSPTTAPIAGIGSRLEPIDIQQRFLFPGPQGGRGRGGRAGGAPPTSAVKVTVTPASGETVTGTLVAMDDFNVTLRDAAGSYRTIHRGPTVKVVKDDPLAAHHALLDTITDKQIHDVVAYLETLK